MHSRALRNALGESSDSGYSESSEDDRNYNSSAPSSRDYRRDTYMSAAYDDAAFINSDDDENVIVEPKAPRMDSSERNFFETTIQQQVLAWSGVDTSRGGSQTRLDEDYGSDSDQIELDNDSLPELEQRSELSERERELDEIEMNDLAKELAPGWKDALISRSRPDECRDVTSMAPFSVFEKSWVAFILSEPLVSSIFMYLQPIACKGMGAVHPELYPTLFCIEMYGLTIDIIEEEEHCVRCRAHFSPRILDGKEGEKKQTDSKREAVKGKVDASKLPSTMKSGNIISSSKPRPDYRRMSMAETIRNEHAIHDDLDNADYNAAMFRAQRKDALRDQAPYKFFWDEKAPVTLQDVSTQAEQGHK